MADNYSAEALKERGHGVIEESKWENFDKMVDNNCKSWMGLRYVDSVLLLCEIMHNEAMPLADRRRQAYDKFQEFDCNGTAAHMICSALRDLCNDGDTVADEIKDFKYDHRMTPEEIRAEVIRMEREYEEMMAEKQKRKLKEYEAHSDRLGITSKVYVCSTYGPMPLVDLPYRFDIDECLNIVQQIGKELGLCYGIFNGVPMFSFDDKHTFFRRQHNGLTEEDYAEYMDALRPEHYDSEKASRILKERTWPHLGKTT